MGHRKSARDRFSARRCSCSYCLVHDTTFRLEISSIVQYISEADGLWLTRVPSEPKWPLQTSPLPHRPQASASPRGGKRSWLRPGEVFEKKGLCRGHAGREEWIALSGGSRQTLYALFGGKQGLFEAIISETCETIFQRADARKTRSPQSTDEVLKEVGTRYLAIVTSPPCLRNLRTPSRRRRDAAYPGDRSAILESSAPAAAAPSWRNFLTANQIERGLPVGWHRQPRRRRRHFIDMLSGTGIRLQCLIGVRQPPTPQEITKRSSTGPPVAQFLHGCSYSSRRSVAYYCSAAYDFLNKAILLPSKYAASRRIVEKSPHITIFPLRMTV